MSNLLSANIYNFSADEVISRLSSGDWLGSWEYLRQLLESLTSSSNIIMNISLQNDFLQEDKKNFITNFAKLAGELILALLSDPSSRIPDKSFSGLIQFHETLHNLFTLAGLGETDQVVTSILGSSKNLSEAQQKKILLLISLNTKLDIVSLLKKIDQKYRVPAVASYLGYMKIIEKNIYENKIKIYAFADDLQKTNADYHTFKSALFTYFTCSYMGHPEKHILKDKINSAVRRCLNASKSDFATIRSRKRQDLKISYDQNKPVLAVFLEVFSKGHAMNRSWGEWVESLRSEFTVVLITPQYKLSEDLLSQYENLLSFANKEDMVRIFHDLNPDVVVFPSVGLDIFGIMASNMRLAPLQMMALGHPATTMSPYIDFVYGQSCLYNEAAFLHDKYIADDSPYRFVPCYSKERISQFYIPVRDPSSKAPLRVSVVGSNLKISSPFLETLEEIVQECQHEIHFSFHMGSVGMDSLYLQKVLSQRFGKIAFFGYQSYEEYFENLRQTDLILNPFPFGHTNTIIDTLLLGKPCIGMDGIEPASRTERCVLDMVGLSDLFIAKDRDEYKLKFHQFAKRILDGQGAFYDRNKVYDQLYAGDATTDFGKILKWVYDNQSLLKSSSQKKFSVFKEIPA